MNHSAEPDLATERHGGDARRAWPGVAALFLRLGFTAFGGPAAHVGIMHDEVVTRHRWLSEGEFMDLLGATNLIPGPNSTEMAIHIGLRRAGWRGLIAGGLGFALPAVLMVLALAWAYVQYGSRPQAAWLLYGIKPVVIAIIAQALWRLGRVALKRSVLVALAAAVIVLYVFHFNEVLLLLGGGLLFMLGSNLQRMRSLKPVLAAPLPAAALAAGVSLGSAAFTLPLLFFIFLKIGAVLYGSGYVLLALLRADLVVRHAWLTDQQLLDAVAIGQVTPGPLFTTATFIGYLLGGLPGAMLATLGIFLPSFLFVALSGPFIPRIRNSAWSGAFLDGVNASALGLMAAVAWQLGRLSLVDPATILLAVAALVLLLRFRVNSTWLIAGGALAGLIAGSVG